MKRYLISPITVYCEDNMLFETKIAVDAIHMPLHYSVWGATEDISRNRALALAEILTNYRSSQNTTGHHNLLVN
jgi:hypothetical protein